MISQRFLYPDRRSPGSVVDPLEILFPCGSLEMVFHYPEVRFVAGPQKRHGLHAVVSQFDEELLLVDRGRRKRRGKHAPLKPFGRGIRYVRYPAERFALVRNAFVLSVAERDNFIKDRSFVESFFYDVFSNVRATQQVLRPSSCARSTSISP